MGTKTSYLHLLLLVLYIGLLMVFLPKVNADNWVCYDTTGTVTEAQLRAQFPVQPQSPLQIIRTNSHTESFTLSSFFRTCENSNTFQYCPENDYYLKSTFQCAKMCTSFAGAHHVYIGILPGVSCGLGGGPYCTSWSDVGSCNLPSTQSFVCGKTNTDWSFMTVSSTWVCPSCSELARRQPSEPQLTDIQSFKDFSYGGGIYKISNSSLDLSFMAYITACINRIPMLNLKVDLIDKNTNKVVNTEYGIYAKHETLNYNAENLGMLEGFHIPEQTEFKKNYILKGTLSGYRAWAWRKRLVDAIDRVTTKDSLTVPGFPTGNSVQQKFGNLYYSTDFLLNKNTVINPNLNAKVKVEKSQEGSINVLKNINQISGTQMCTMSDLKNYISNFGVTTDLLNNIGKVIPLINGATYKNITVSKGNDKIVNFDINNIKLTKADVGNVTLFADKLDNLFSMSQKLVYLKANNVVSNSQITNKASSIVSSWFDYSPNLGCGKYAYKVNNLALSNLHYNIVKKYYTTTLNNGSTVVLHNDTMFLNLSMKGVWYNDIIANLVFDYDIYYNVQSTWSFATLASLDPKVLAECLYHWDACILKNVNDNNNKVYTEVADCGMGPPSKLAEPSMKDGARGKKTISLNLTVYRKCDIGKDWIAKNKVYSCVDGKYYKCQCGLSDGDLLLNMKSAQVGDTLKRKNGLGYVCKTNCDWQDISCVQ